LARTQSMQLAASSLLAHRPSTEATQLLVEDCWQLPIMQLSSSAEKSEWV
jgi:hypothetical protein